MAGGRFGRKKSAQLFSLLHIFTDGLRSAFLGNVHFCNLLRIPAIGFAGFTAFQLTIFFLLA